MVEAQIDEIGPNFNRTLFIGLLKRAARGAFERKCKKVTNDDGAYVKAVDAVKSLITCVGNWSESEITANYYHAKFTRDYKPLLKA